MRIRGGLLSLCAVGALAGCGIPTGGAAETIAPSSVPYGLASPTSSPPTAASVPARRDLPRVYLVNAGDVLVPSSRDISGATVRQRLGALLAELAAGPTAGDQDAHLATDLPPGIHLSVAGIDGDTATVDISGIDQAPSGQQSRRAVGQIVLTATSLPEIRAVRLTRDGKPVEAPLPSGELTSDPLTAADYGPPLVAPPS